VNTFLNIVLPAEHSAGIRKATSTSGDRELGAVELASPME